MVEGRKLSNKPYDEMSEDERFCRYGTSSHTRLANALRRIEAVGIKGALDEVKQDERNEKAEEDLKIAAKEVAKKIAAKLVSGEELNSHEQNFLAVNGDLIEEFLK